MPGVHSTGLGIGSGLPLYTYSVLSTGRYLDASYVVQQADIS